jgi:hypothetical protein
MLREIDMKEISDGKLYGLNDMVKADCRDCKGCSDCCRHMGTSITLDPLDIYRLTSKLSCSFEEMLGETIEIHIVDDMILPNLLMKGKEECCPFLNQEGRCQIHPFRPGMCRIFPLGRYYENRSFQYFLQVHECRNQNKTKIKVKKWIDADNLSKQEQYIADWHYFLRDIQEIVQSRRNENFTNDVRMYVLNLFFVKAYQPEQDFYAQFYERLEEAKKIVF